ncbi:hypothetical protein ALQ77_03195 [Pseudomonas corrugata]|uniref:Uncharacterized protein n=2 Tax=Pseudomonas corrugata TaxID=47879 RepID=A0A3M3DXF2_9PSED|nr:hypothetical protein ALQ77_03195 [Pseudomonas corrugata]
MPPPFHANAVLRHLPCKERIPFMNVATPEVNIFDSILLKTKKIIIFAWSSLSWSLPIKLIIGALLGALGGSSILGLLSEYATYFYAISYGVRPPIEGIPYLKASVTLINLAFLISGSLIYCLTILAFKIFAKLNNWTSYLVKWRPNSRIPRLLMTFNPDLSEYFKNKPWWLGWAAAIATGTIIYSIFFIIAYPQNLTKIRPDILNIAIISYSIFAAFAFITLIRPSTIKWIALITTAIYFSAWVVFLFNPNYYSNLLRLVGYGGGIPVTIELIDSTSSKNNLDKKLYLIIRSTEAFILLNDSTNQFIEIPKNQIKMIKHDTGGLDYLLPYLPTIDQQIQRSREAESTPADSGG